jgi:hypothetical protein
MLHLEAALVLHRKVGDQDSIAATLENLGELAVINGDLVQGQTLFEDGLAIARSLSAKKGIAHLLSHLADIALRQGRLDAARDLLVESLILVQRLGDQWLALRLLGHVAKLSVSKGKPQVATRLLGAECALREQANMPAPPTAEREARQSRAEARALLGEDAFLRSWEEGRALEFEQALALALKEA